MSDTEECLINVAAAASAGLYQEHQTTHGDNVIGASDDSDSDSSSQKSPAPQQQQQHLQQTNHQLEDTTSSSDSDASDADDNTGDAKSDKSDNDDDDDDPTTSKTPRLTIDTATVSPTAVAPAVDDQPTTAAASSNSNVVASHYNTLEEKGLAERRESRILHMRNFNNWIKSMLINEYITRIRDASKLGAPLRVLDMCCGKGGDLYKWEKAHITHLICTDIAAVSVEQCEARYRTLIERHTASGGSGKAGGGKFFTAEFFACDSTRTRLRNQYADPSIELNLVSCQFAFHYCFESLAQAECMIKNAAECLRTGGYFIGTIPDAYEIVRRQQAAKAAAEAAGTGGGPTTFGNEVYRIGFLCDEEQPPLFGGKYNFQLHGVVDCPEFLVHFPLLVKLARKYGLQLVMKESFGGYFRRMVETSKGLMEKMQALQTYPTHEHQPAKQSAEQREQFAHAAEFLQRQRTADGGGGGGYDRNRKCGTLSKAEWEATSIYIVFAFQKMEKKFDSKGELYFD